VNRAAEIFRKRKDWNNVAKALDLSVYIDHNHPKVQSLFRESAVEAAS
jgi:hypothetical protein